MWSDLEKKLKNIETRFTYLEEEFEIVKSEMEQLKKEQTKKQNNTNNSNAKPEMKPPVIDKPAVEKPNMENSGFTDFMRKLDKGIREIK